MEITTATLHEIVQQVSPGADLARWWNLSGGFSASMTAIEVHLPNGGARKLVVRLHGDRDLAINPDVALDEYRLLQILSRTRLPVAKPLHLDQTREDFDRPVLVLEYIEGSSQIPPDDLASALSSCAQMLARIHNILPDDHDLKFLPKEEERNSAHIDERPETPDDALQETHIRNILEKTWPPAIRNPSVLLHGDFWPGNLLWRDSTIVAIIDWENARLGDPVEDLANTRMEINWAFGPHAMEAFTNEYQAVSNVDMAMLPVWDLCAALRPAGRIEDWSTTREEADHMRAGHASFVEQAIAKL